jgi:hypothetical protein
MANIIRLKGEKEERRGGEGRRGEGGEEGGLASPVIGGLEYM